MNRPAISPLCATTEKQLGTYALAALAGAGVLTTAQVANAQILTSTAGGQTLTNSTGTIYLFANEGGFGANSGPAVNLSLPSYHSASSYARLAGVANLSPLGNNGNNYAFNLAKSTTVSANAVHFVSARSFRIGFHSHSSSTDRNLGNFHGTTGYLGFKFTDPTTGKTDYGWAQLTESAHQDSLTLDAAAYDESGASIRTGQTVSSVPEPSSLALLAAGAGCLAAWRLHTAKRKQAADAGATPVS